MNVCLTIIQKDMNRFICFLLLITVLLFLFSGLGFGQEQNHKSQTQNAEYLIRSGQLKQARQILENLYSQSPDNPDLYNRLKDLLFEMQDYDDAFQLIQNRKRKYPDDINLDVSLGHALIRMQRQQEALDLWYRLIEKHSQNPSVYQSIAQVMINERLLDEAIEVYLLFREKTGKQQLFTFNLISLYLSRMNFGKATDEMIQYLVKNPKHLTVVDNYFIRYPKTQRVMQEVTQKLKKAVEDHPEHMGLRELLMKTYVRAENFDMAFRETSKIEARSNNSGQFIFRLGKEAFQAGEPQQAERAYREIIKNYKQYSDLDQVMSGLAQSLEAQGKFDEAAGLYRQTADRTKDFNLGAESLLRQGLIQRDQLFAVDESIQTFKTLQKKYPASAQSKQAAFEEAGSYVVLGDLKSANDIYLQNLNRQKGVMDRFWIQSVVGHAEVLFLELQFAKMQDILEILTSDSLPEAILKDPVLNDGLELQLLVKMHLKNSLPQLKQVARAEFLTKQHKYKPAIFILDSLVATGEKHPLIAYGLYKKGLIQMHIQSFASGIATLDTLITHYPTSILSDYALERTAWAFERMGKNKEAFNRYEMLLVEYPQSFLADDVRKRIRALEGK